MLQFDQFVPQGCNFPPAKVPVLPSVQWDSFAWNGATSHAQSIFALPTTRHYTHSRYALLQAYRSCGVGPLGALLAPAYHCRTMLDPAQALNAPVEFYALNQLLVPEVDSIAAVFQSSKVPIRALLVPHYFGRPQPDGIWQKLAQFCKSKEIALIEDCAHAWQIAVERAHLSDQTSNHFITASPYKFFGSDSGGLLWGKHNELNKDSAQSTPWNLANELRSAVGSLRRWKSSLQTVDIAQLETDIQRAMTQKSQCGQDLLEIAEGYSDQFDEASSQNSSSRVSRWIVRHSKFDQIPSRRRENFNQWQKACSSLHRARPLFEAIDVRSTPYMFPLLIDRPDKDFFVLKQMGLPVWRWDDMARTSCRVSARLRLHLLHLPCHQSLSSKQMEWMTAAVRKVLQ